MIEGRVSPYTAYKSNNKMHGSGINKTSLALDIVTVAAVVAGVALIILGLKYNIAPAYTFLGGTGLCFSSAAISLYNNNKRVTYKNCPTYKFEGSSFWEKISRFFK